MKSDKKKRRVATPIISKTAPFPFVEAYKSFRTNLQFASINKEIKKIIITSSIPGEGKSVVSINLAIAMASAGSKVLLVDTDLRRPALHRYLRLNNAKIGGLTSVLSGAKSLDECLVHFNDLDIHFLSCGPIPPNPAELLGSKRMGNIIRELEGQFDYLIFDTPPVSVVTDAAVLSQYTDGAILVVRQNYVTTEAALQAKKNLENVGTSIIGSVMNDFRAQKSNKSSSYHHSGKYNYYYN